MRSSVLLNLLLFYRSYGDGRKIFQDVALADEVERYLARLFPDEAQRPIPPSTIIRQFGRQILIQPLLSGAYQVKIAGELYERPGSPIDRIASETGKQYLCCAELPKRHPDNSCEPHHNALRFVRKAGRDIYHFEKPATWFDRLEAFAAQGLSQVSVLSRAFRWSALAIPALRPDVRSHAYRYRNAPSDDLKALYSSPAFHRLPIDQRLRVEDAIMQAQAREASGLAASQRPEQPVAGPPGLTLNEALGELNPWDGYLVGCNDAVTDAYYENRAIDAGLDIAPTSTLYGKLFLQNLRWIDTFITQAAMDLVVYSTVLPLALANYSDIVEDVSVHDRFLTITYKDRALPEMSSPRQRTIYFPLYPQAGHGVPASAPRKILNDVRDWLLSHLN